MSFVTALGMCCHMKVVQKDKLGSRNGQRGSLFTLLEKVRLKGRLKERQKTDLPPPPLRRRGRNLGCGWLAEGNFKNAQAGAKEINLNRVPGKEEWRRAREDPSSRFPGTHQEQRINASLNVARIHPL